MTSGCFKSDTSLFNVQAINNHISVAVLSAYAIQIESAIKLFVSGRAHISASKVVESIH